jgi:(+)-pinoresinol hydroxylase
MKHFRLIVALLVGCGVLQPVWALDTAGARGKAVFDLWCAACHKAAKPGDMPVAGTASLERQYQGTKPAALEQRTDLTTAYVKLLVRKGRKSMPFTRKTEISDSDLDALAAYLAKTK